MKISVISDVHLGYARGTEREEDSFEAFSEAIKKSIDCDAILIAGDLFDSRNPGTDVLARAMEILIEPLASPSDVSILNGDGKDVTGLSPVHHSGIPVIAIHGTHERRAKGLINPVQALEKAGFLIHLHCNSVVLRKGDESVCIHGMSGVPDQYSEAVLRNWKPEPLAGCFNILMLHQSLKPFVFSSHSIDLSVLPKGFDLYVCGHAHDSKKASCSGSPLLIPGSLITTQITKESASPRGFWTLDTEKAALEFHELENQRKIYVEDIEGSAEKIESRIKEILSERHKKKPIIRFRTRNREVLDASGIARKFHGSALVSFRLIGTGDEAQPVRSIEEHRLSVEELGRKLLEENLSSMGLNSRVFESLFDIMRSGRQDDGLSFLRSSVKELFAKEEK